MKSSYRKEMLLAFLCLVIAMTGRSNDFIIVKGYERAEIFVSGKASAVEKYAARELQRAIQLMSGMQLKITDKAAEGQIIIGTPASQAGIAAMSKELQLQGAGDEQIAVHRIGNSLFLAGNTPGAALYATYALLTDVLGVRWYWPGPTGEYVPERKTLTIGALKISDSPDLKIRSLAITGVPNGDPDTDTWMARNRLNLVSSKSGGDSSGTIIPARREKGFLIRIAGHNVVLPEEMLKAHPEYLALIGGKRQFHPRNASHLCWSNSAVQEEVAKMIAGWWNKSPEPDIIHFYPADQTLYCTCDDCKAMGDISTRWQQFSGIVIDKLEKRMPGKRYWTYAYLEYKKVPGTKPAPFELIPYALYDVSYRHLLSSGNAFNKESIAEVDGWLQKGVNMGIRGYEYIIFKDPVFVPMTEWVVDQMRWMHQKKLTAYMSELPAYGMPRNVPEANTYWATNRMALYAATRAMWDTDISVDSLMKDWCATIYGTAANEMLQYYKEIAAAWYGSSEKITLFLNSPVLHVDDFLGPEVFKKLDLHFEAAAKQTASLRDQSTRTRVETQLALERTMLENWKTIYSLKHTRASQATMDTTRKGILIYDGGAESSPLLIELNRAGWDVAVEGSDEAKLRPYLNSNASVLLIRYSKENWVKKGLSNKFLQKDVQSFIQKGGLVLLVADGEIPVSDWFAEVPAVKWTGTEPVQFRKTNFLQPGSWQSSPNDMVHMLAKGLPPKQGYRPLEPGWQTMATVPMSSGRDAPYLLRKRLGKGWLLLSSVPMGFGGGFELFSARNAMNMVKLIENLQADK
ncbi:MAG: DUF4838 domain-containing protein [Pseudobacter sp.]|uniref:DUF4838 domain-containing protein n=1 Tax=Pseudobacter sp. TaxID=2045420 RepID=UPI003F813F64